MLLAEVHADSLMVCVLDFLVPAGQFGYDSDVTSSDL